MRKKKFNLLSRVRESFITKVIALNLAFFMLFQITWPTVALALSGGPSQPEVGGFQPVDTSDMVDIFSGDFKYNIPLMDMDGYPLNIAYNGGATMDQEASWVGLGWNLNPGVINRSMRGLPDDFNGEQVIKTFNTKPSRNFGINAGVTLELFGLDFSKVFSGTINFGLGVSYSNYYGIGIEQTIGVNFKAQVGPLTAGLGITSSSENGLTIAPNLSLGISQAQDDATKESSSLSASLGIGTSYNTRAGVKQLTVTTSISRSNKLMQDANKDKSKNHTYNSSGSIGTSSSFDLGIPTFTPSVSMPMHNIGINANFQVGSEVFGTHPSGYIGGYYNGQKLETSIRSNSAFGYMNLEAGQNNQNALLDFNRENDGEFTTVTPALPVTNLTYDTYGVSGQGVGGSYRPFRSEVGHVFDAYNYSTSEGFDLGLEFGVGNLIHGAGQFSVNISQTSSGRWLSGNGPASNLQYGKKGSNIDHEKYYFKEANESSVDSDPSYFTKFGGGDPKRFELNTATNFNVTAKNNFNGGAAVPSVNYRQKREKRNMVINPLTIAEVKQGNGLDNYPSSSYAQSSAQGYHVGEITSLGTDGMRYVYGIPAYNTKQLEVSFAVGTDMYGSGGLSGNCHTGLVTYTPGSDNTTGNSKGLDNHYNSTETPAFAHSYLLTAVLSPDYIDADAIKGPSIGDLGYYTKFSYIQKYSNYKWRTPIEANKANYNEGLKTDPSDDKASYVYGEKEIWYIDKIESKNYIAVFLLENRKDALGVNGENGGVNTSQPSQLLRKISFYVRKEYIADPVNAIPLKEVHFEYDYSLCPGIPNRSNSVPLTNPTENGTGKLTLKKVYFTYQNSNKARLSPYEFKYTGSNPSYDPKGYDRWGNYKENLGGCTIGSAPDNAEFPYVKQDQTTADDYTSAWNLTQVFLPSGGSINVEYESDDYAYVQHKKANQMFKIVGITGDGTPATTTINGLGPQSLSDPDKYLVFELDPDADTPADIGKYTEGITDVYFKCLMQMVPGAYDYVSGYAELDGSPIFVTDGSGNNYGAIKLKKVNWNDSGAGGETNPINVCAVQFGRLHLQRLIYSNPAIAESDGFGEALINELIGSDLLANVINNVVEFTKGPNKFLYEGDNGVGSKLVFGKSWLRLSNPDKKKLGGGCRVKTIKMNDSWATMDLSAGISFDYGQQYFYDSNGDGTGTSTGVAAYEPQIGGEENPWKQSIAYTKEIRLAPDEKMYQEEPLGESFFPSPGIGYSKVTVQNLKRTGVTKHATGKVVHQFFTAYDFPTIVARTDKAMERDKTNPFSISSLLNIASRDYLTVSQGFSVETNDMHGKPKMQEVFQELQTTPITSVRYKYKSSPYSTNSFRLENTVTTVTPDGDVNPSSTIGVFFDMVADMRESKSKNETFKINVNGESFLVLAVPVTVLPIPIPSKMKDETQFHSAATTKVIQRFGILEETEARDLGSVVTTKNLAYDSETGDVLATQTTTDFNDAIYTLNYPAHWFYDKGMGQAYKNLGIVKDLVVGAGGVANVTAASTIYVPGDEIKMNSSGLRAWVVAVATNSITLVEKNGNAIAIGSYDDTKIIRSGRRNLQGTNIASITSLANPLTNFKSNLFSNVLQASAVEFTDQWRTFCDCFDPSGAFAGSTTNPYVLGTRGNWRMKKSLLHLAPRTQSHYNNNTNIRKDGMFTSYTPYYRLNSGNWMIDGKNWTFTSEVTEFSPFGQELENRDALGRYSAATFGYRQTFATAVAANSRYSDVGFDNFEDYGFSPCADNHFKFTDHVLNVTTGQSHTGRTSMKVTAGSIVSMTKYLDICEPEGCNLGLTGGLASFFTIINGTAPYNIQSNIHYGDPSLDLTTTGFIITSTGTFSLEVVITDANGCQYTTVINN